MNARLLFSTLLALTAALSARAQINAPPADAAAAAPMPPPQADVAPPAFAPPIGDEVTLFYAAEITGPVAKRVPKGHPGLAAAKPHTNAAKAAEGWKFVELKESYIGFAPANTVRKDLTVRPGEPILQLPSASSPAIGVAAGEPPTTVEVIEGDWARVSLPAAIVVYFQETISSPAPAPTAPAPAPVAVVPIAVAPAAPAPAAAAPIVAQNATPVTGASAADLPRYYVGILKLRSNPTLGGPASAKYLLLSSDNRLIALVNADNVLSPTPVSSYINKPVRVYGLAESSTEFPAAIIKAQLIQPAQ